jgi:predicted DsbA family dithiol-disulfide isomerase
VLIRLAADVGLRPEDVRVALAEESQAASVRADQAEARALGINGVPFFVVGRRYGVSGAQPADALLQVLKQAWAEAHPLQMVTAPEGTACGPDGCAI